jgi:hypothetical protein
VIDCSEQRVQLLFLNVFDGPYLPGQQDGFVFCHQELRVCHEGHLPPLTVWVVHETLCCGLRRVKRLLTIDETIHGVRGAGLVSLVEKVGAS